jgi:hypothetical protein
MAPQGQVPVPNEQAVTPDDGALKKQREVRLNFLLTRERECKPGLQAFWVQQMHSTKRSAYPT